jgi:hypothetical protein
MRLMIASDRVRVGVASLALLCALVMNTPQVIAAPPGRGIEIAPAAPHAVSPAPPVRVPSVPHAIVSPVPPGPGRATIVPHAAVSPIVPVPLRVPIVPHGAQTTVHPGPVWQAPVRGAASMRTVPHAGTMTPRLALPIMPGVRANAASHPRVAAPFPRRSPFPARAHAPSPHVGGYQAIHRMGGAAVNPAYRGDRLAKPHSGASRRALRKHRRSFRQPVLVCNNRAKATGLCITAPSVE